MAPTYEFVLIDRSDNPTTHRVAGVFEVCPMCEGHGTHLAFSLQAESYTPEEFRQVFTREEQAAYFTRGGMLDVVCAECRGLRVVVVANPDAMEPADLIAYGALLGQREAEARCEREHEAERSMGG